MNTNILGMILSIIYIGAVIGGSGLVAKKYSNEASRKFIHILLGNWWLIAMFFFFAKDLEKTKRYIMGCNTSNCIYWYKLLII